MVLLNEEALSWCYTDGHPRSADLPRIIRYESFDKLTWHKAEYECVAAITAIGLLAVRVHEDRQGVWNPFNIDLLIEGVITFVVSDDPPPANPTLNLETSGRGISIPLCLTVIFNMSYELLNNLCT